MHFIVEMPVGWSAKHSGKCMSAWHEFQFFSCWLMRMANASCNVDPLRNEDEQMIQFKGAPMRYTFLSYTVDISIYPSKIVHTGLLFRYIRIISLTLKKRYCFFVVKSHRYQWHWLGMCFTETELYASLCIAVQNAMCMYHAFANICKWSHVRFVSHVNAIKMPRINWIFAFSIEVFVTVKCMALSSTTLGSLWLLLYNIYKEYTMYSLFNSFQSVALFCMHWNYFHCHFGICGDIHLTAQTIGKQCCCCSFKL